MKAVKAGYSFNLFPEEDLMHISLEKTKGMVQVDGRNYPLYCGATFADSAKVDILLDERGELPIREHRVRPKERER